MLARSVNIYPRVVVLAYFWTFTFTFRLFNSLINSLCFAFIWNPCKPIANSKFFNVCNLIWERIEVRSSGLTVESTTDTVGYFFIVLRRDKRRSEIA